MGNKPKHEAGPLTVMYSINRVELHLAAESHQTSAATRLLELDRTPENVAFALTLAAAVDLKAALKGLLGANGRRSGPGEHSLWFTDEEAGKAAEKAARDAVEKAGG